MAIRAGDLPLPAGGPAWLAKPAWGFMPLLLISVYLFIAIYRLLQPDDSSNRKFNYKSQDQENQQKRLKIIDEGRRLIATFNEQTHHASFPKFLQTQESWHHIRPKLNPSVVRDIENFRLAVATRGDVKDGKVYYLIREIERLEKEWALD